MAEKPQYLYRGIKLNYELLQQLQLYGVEIKPHYEPLIDQYGRKTVSDGNEYGVYMTDNLTMAQQAYGSVRMVDGTIIRKDLRLNVSDRPTPLSVPAVGVVYKINTAGIDVHKPWISSQLTGHYNNGFQGDEWIAPSIPSTNYSVVEATIGPDWLHDSQKINVSNIVVAQNQIKMIVERRKQQLEILGKELEKLTPMKRMQLTNQDMQLYRDLFGDAGVRYTNSEDMILNDGLDYTKYLLSVFYHANTEQLDYTTLLYIETLKNRIKAGESVDKLAEFINADILLNAEKRQAFIDKKAQSGEVANTLAFDRKQEMYNKVFGVLRTKKNSMNQQNQQNQDSHTHNDRKDEEALFREKYGYDDMTDDEKLEFDEKLAATLHRKKLEEKKEELTEIKDDLKRKGWSEKLEQFAPEMGIDLDSIFRQQQLEELQREQMEQVESVERSGRRM